MAFLLYPKLRKGITLKYFLKGTNLFILKAEKRGVAKTIFLSFCNSPFYSMNAKRGGLLAHYGIDFLATGFFVECELRAIRCLFVLGRLLAAGNMM